jgi:hypothetical protein
LFSGQGEDNHPLRAGDGRGGVAEVAAEGGLAVGAGGHELEAAGAEDRGEEVADLPAAAEGERQRRDRERGVLGEQGDDLGDVSALVSRDEPLDQGVFLR